MPQTQLSFCITQPIHYTPRKKNNHHSFLHELKNTVMEVGGEALPELGVGCFSLDVSMPAPIKFMIFSICPKRTNMKN